MEASKITGWQRRKVKWAGADPELLQRCPSEMGKYVGYGNTILLTAVLASISGGYAFYAVSHNPWLGVCFGPLWGVVIFNLDCIIIRSMRKPLVPSRADTLMETDEEDFAEGRRTKKLHALRKELKREEWGLFLVRFIAAVLIGCMVALPLETVIFSKRIDKYKNTKDKQEIDEKKNKADEEIEALQQRRENVNERASRQKRKLYENDTRLNELKRSDSLLLARSNEAQTKQESAAREYGRSLRWVTDSAGKTRAIETTASKKWKEKMGVHEKEVIEYKSRLKVNEEEEEVLLQELDRKAQKLQADTDETLEKIKINEQKNAIKVADVEKEAEAYAQMDLIERVQLLNEIRSTDRSVLWTSVLITLMMVLIEVAPVSVKFMTKRGLYDELLELKESEVLSQQRFRIYKTFEQINSYVRVQQEKNAQREQTELKIHEQAMEDIADNRTKLIKELIAQNGKKN